MTEKQRSFLRNYITEDRVNKLNDIDFNFTVSFINLISNTSNSYHKFCLIDIMKRIKCTELESYTIEKMVNDNREYYTKTISEYCSVIRAYEIPKYDKRIYEMHQSWCKGSFDEVIKNNFYIFEDGEKFSGFYNILVDMEIYRVTDFMKYLRDNSFKEDK